MSQRYQFLVDDLPEYDDAFEDLPDEPDDAWADPAELALTLGEALDDGYATASVEDLEDALSNVLDSMSPAEAFNFAKALKQIERGAARVVADPAFGQVAATVLPIAGGAAGTLIGGPVGTALGTSLGTAAVKALPGRTTRTAPAGRAPVPVAGGSAAAAQGLVLSQQPDVLKALLALAMGQHGQKTVNGAQVGQVMGMLSSVFGRAAEDADALFYAELGETEDDYLSDEPFESWGDRDAYAALMDAENIEIADVAEDLESP